MPWWRCLENIEVLSFGDLFLCSVIHNLWLVGLKLLESKHVHNMCRHIVHVYMYWWCVYSNYKYTMYMIACVYMYMGTCVTFPYKAWWRKAWLCDTFTKVLCNLASMQMHDIVRLSDILHLQNTYSITKSIVLDNRSISVEESRI
jgi:hypothetical protein